MNSSPSRHFDNPRAGPRTRRSAKSSLENIANVNRPETSKLDGSCYGAKKRGCAKQKKNQSSPKKILTSDLRLRQFLDEASYEAYIDPYRGMAPFFSISFHEHNPNSEAKQQSLGNIGATSPWTRCAKILHSECPSWCLEGFPSNGNFSNNNTINFSTPTVQNSSNEDNKTRGSSIDKSTTTTKGGQKSPEAVLLRCGCPSLDHLALGAWELDQKRKNAKKKRKQQSENNIHSYQLTPKKIKRGRNDTRTCGRAISDSGFSYHKCIPRVICGERSENEYSIYSCDFNPFCLASIGGMMCRFVRRNAERRYLLNDSGNQKNNVQMGDLPFNDHRGSSIRGEEETMQNPDLANKEITFDMTASFQGGNNEGNEATDDIRDSHLINREIVLSHISRFVCKDSNKAAIHGCLETIESSHNSLILPSKQVTCQEKEIEENQTNDCIQLSTPPGLRNLGATCYLNSQLQCLAQNLAFTQGVFSWKRSLHRPSSDLDDRMSHVLTTMQTILARMRYGPEKVVCTNEFVSALSLENDEMQDPNEFARLLFDRMQDSFRQSVISGYAFNQSQLENLLPNIYGGICLYTTTCSNCEQCSERREHFMEITVPIVRSDLHHNSNSDDSDSTSKSFHSDADVDVQQCINAYLHPESLEEENQYFCGECNKKCNALRRLTLEKLPPVLNIQLARYVFDRKTFAKRKLMTKVFLPRVLRVPMNLRQRQGKRKNKPGNAEYILCAVQNHIGESAYGGHYIAEAMDWMTGVWYEFNDNEVTVLEGGPTSSFEPCLPDLSGESNGSSQSCTSEIGAQNSGVASRFNNKFSKIHGSADAYNLFYVERSYLSERTQEEELRWKEKDKARAEAKPSIYEDVVAYVENQRRERYRVENQRRKAKQRLDERICRKRARVWNHFFAPKSKLVIESPTEFGSGSSADHVWVDSKTLRQLFSENDGMVDIFQNASKLAILCNKRFLCTHSKGLHPRIAREGKLLPRQAYESFTEILRQEYDAFMHDESGAIILPPSARPAISQLEFVDGKNIVCEECALPYQTEIRKKLELFKLLISLYDDFGQTENDLKPEVNLCAISCSFVSSFRKYVEGKVKSVTNEPSAKYSDQQRRLYCAGLDLLDLNEVTCAESMLFSQQADRTQNSSGSDNLDVEVNRKITCSHGMCPFINNRRNVRLIPASVWSKVVQVFPDAITHKVRSLTTQLNSSSEDKMVGNCEKCFLEKAEEQAFPGKLRDWMCNILGENTRERPCQYSASCLEKLLRRGGRSKSNETHLHYPLEIETMLGQSGAAQDGNITLYLLHRADVQRWRDVFDKICKVNKSKRKNDEIKKQLIELLRRPTQSPSSSQEWVFRSLACLEHQKTVGVPPFPHMVNSSESSVVDDTSVKIWLGICKEYNLELLTKQEYLELANSIEALCVILRGNSCTIPYHSMIDLCSKKTSDETKPSQFYTIEKSPSVTITIIPSVGMHQKQPTGFLLTIEPPICKLGCAYEISDNLTTDDLAENYVQTLTKDCDSGTGNLGPDEERIQSISVCVHEIDANVDVEVAASMIKSELNKTPPNCQQRKSGRKRNFQGSFPQCVLNISSHDNLAHLRLLLHQSTHKSVIDQSLFFVRNDDEKLLAELTHDLNERKICEILTELSSSDGTNFSFLRGRYDAHIILSCSKGGQAKATERRHNTRKKLSEKESEDERRMLSSLRDIACDGNVVSHYGSGTCNSKRKHYDNGESHFTKKGRVERGFRGTFLQSSSGLPPKEGDSKDSVQQENREKLTSTDGLSVTDQNVYVLGGELFTDDVNHSDEKVVVDLINDDCHYDEPKKRIIGLPPGHDCGNIVLPGMDNQNTLTNSSAKFKMNVELISPQNEPGRNPLNREGLKADSADLPLSCPDLVHANKSTEEVNLSKKLSTHNIARPNALDKNVNSHGNDDMEKSIQKQVTEQILSTIPHIEERILELLKGVKRKRIIAKAVQNFESSLLENIRKVFKRSHDCLESPELHGDDMELNKRIISQEIDLIILRLIEKEYATITDK